MTNDELQRARELHEQWANGPLRESELLEARELFGRLCGIARVVHDLETSFEFHKERSRGGDENSGVVYGLKLAIKWIRGL